VAVIKIPPALKKFAWYLFPNQGIMTDKEDGFKRTHIFKSLLDPKTKSAEDQKAKGCLSL